MAFTAPMVVALERLWANGVSTSLIGMEIAREFPDYGGSLNSSSIAGTVFRLRKKGNQNLPERLLVTRDMHGHRIGAVWSAGLKHSLRKKRASNGHATPRFGSAASEPKPRPAAPPKRNRSQRSMDQAAKQRIQKAQPRSGQFYYGTLGTQTRGAISGSIVSGPSHDQAAVVEARKVVSALERKVVKLDDTAPAPKMLLELANDECRWPVSSPGGGTYFCGRKITSRGSYCDQHRRR